jgi:hypothetical protein
MTPHKSGLAHLDAQVVQGIFASLLQVNPMLVMPTDAFHDVVHKPILVSVQPSVSPVSSVRYTGEARRNADTPFEHEHFLKPMTRAHATSRWVDLTIELPDY